MVDNYFIRNKKSWQQFEDEEYRLEEFNKGWDSEK
jgi:hypothetical protein